MRRLYTILSMDDKGRPMIDVSIIAENGNDVMKYIFSDDEWLGHFVNSVLWSNYSYNFFGRISNIQQDIVKKFGKSIKELCNNYKVPDNVIKFIKDHFENYDATDVEFHHDNECLWTCVTTEWNEFIHLPIKDNDEKERIEYVQSKNTIIFSKLK